MRRKPLRKGTGVFRRWTIRTGPCDENKKRKTVHIMSCGEGVSERVDRVLKKYGVATAMRRHTNVRRLLVHPKRNVEPEEQGELDEYKKDVENAPKERYPRNEKQQ